MLSGLSCHSNSLNRGTSSQAGPLLNHLFQVRTTGSVTSGTWPLICTLHHSQGTFAINSGSRCLLPIELHSPHGWLNEQLLCPEHARHRCWAPAVPTPDMSGTWNFSSGKLVCVWEFQLSDGCEVHTTGSSWGLMGTTSGFPTCTIRRMI